MSSTHPQGKASLRAKSAPLPPMAPTYPKTIQKNIQKLKRAISNNKKQVNEKEKKAINVKPARKWLW